MRCTVKTSEQSGHLPNSRLSSQSVHVNFELAYKLLDTSNETRSGQSKFVAQFLEKQRVFNSHDLRYLPAKQVENLAKLLSGVDEFKFLEAMGLKDYPSGLNNHAYGSANAAPWLASNGLLPGVVPPSPPSSDAKTAAGFT